jgi:small-conductance mechanosensitive channel
MVLGIKGKLKQMVKITHIVSIWLKELKRMLVAKYEFVLPIMVDSKGSGEMQKIIGLAISLLIAASIMPVTLQNIAQANTTGWDPTARTLWPLLSIFGVLAIVLIFMKYVTKSK